jgi:hypothetical protein
MSAARGFGRRASVGLFGLGAAALAVTFGYPRWRGDGPEGATGGTTASRAGGAAVVVVAGRPAPDAGQPADAGAGGSRQRRGAAGGPGARGPGSDRGEADPAFVKDVPR